VSTKTELREMKAAELRERAREEGIPGISDMRKDDLIEALARDRDDSADEAGDGVDEPGAAGDAGPDGGRIRTGDQTSKSLKYSQEITSPDDEPERAGRSLATTSHEVIRQWAEARGGTPATVDGTEHDGHAGVLRFNVSDEADRLREISWEEWFETFDSRGLNFIYQEERSDGAQSNFFRLENPDREDA